VKCKHGATIGQIDPAQLFYMRSRGISQADARKLLVYAFASEMINLVETTSLRESLEQALFTKFQKA
jgi:Fe-S cluster assembly protein SufD